MPLPVQEALWQSSDDPRTALDPILRQAAEADRAGDAEGRFWWELAALRIHLRRAQHDEARLSAQAASAALARMAKPSEGHQLWLQLGTLDAVASTDEPAKLLPQATALRERSIAIGDERLACEATNLELWLLTRQSNDDEAWLAAEALERCARRLEIPEQVAAAQLLFAILKRSKAADGVTGLDPLRHLDLALEALGNKPARYFRMIIEWEAGLALGELKQYEQAIVRLERSRALSQNLVDHAAVAMANVEIAGVLLKLGRPAEMLVLLNDAPRLLSAQSASELKRRMPRVLQLRIQALTKLGRPEVLAVVEQARAAMKADTGETHVGLQRAMAGALASQQRHAAAYETLLAADETQRLQRSTARDSQLLRLQARYENARRDTENAELRLRTQSSRAALQAEADRRRMLTAIAVALAVLATVALTYAWRQLARHRRMSDLALRDELTGQPNRRAVQAYAEEQFRQARRLGLLMAVAVIDLDHFKTVNDRFGHAVGDLVLRAFGQTMGSALRGQDRLGRWGGEEWLLVLPGTRIDEMSLLFNRLSGRFANAEIPGLPEGARCTFSMGVAEIGAQMRDVQAMIAAADAALYVAKQQGRDRYTVASGTGQNPVVAVQACAASAATTIAAEPTTETA